MVSSLLIVEDDNDLRSLLKETLLDNGFAVHAVTDGVTAIAEIKKTRPDLVILDLGLPKMTGESVCTEIKSLYPDLPVIILTAKNTTSDVVKGFNIGADDYVAKPFDMKILIARIKSQLNKNSTRNDEIKVADLILNTKTLEVARGNKKIHLTPQELKLLEYLMQNEGRVLTRDMILNRIWLFSSDVDTRVVDVYIGYLRKKIDSGFKTKLIHSKRGFGYVCGRI